MLIGGAIYAREYRDAFFLWTDSTNQQSLQLQSKQAVIMKVLLSAVLD